MFVSDTESLLCKVLAEAEETVLIVEAVFTVTYELSLQKQLSI
jgi:hypothetical protein